MVNDESATIRRFLSLAAVALGLAVAAPDDPEVEAQDTVETRQPAARILALAALPETGGTGAASTADRREPPHEPQRLV